jgi:hypothetical protein
MQPTRNTNADITQQNAQGHAEKAHIPDVSTFTISGIDSVKPACQFLQAHSCLQLFSSRMAQLAALQQKARTIANKRAFLHAPFVSSTL